MAVTVAAAARLDLLLDGLYAATSLLSYRVVAACLAGVPVTYGLGVALASGGSKAGTRPNGRFLLLAATSWLLWAFAALIITPAVLDMLPGSHYSLTKQLPRLPRTHVDAVSGAAAAVAFVGELLMLKAVLVALVDTRGSSSSGGPAAASAAPPRHASKHRPVLASAAVVVLGLLLSVTGVLLLLAIDFMPDVPSRVLYCCLALSCLLIASSTTYGLGGHLRYSAGSSEDAGTTWRFVQPFAGGTAFVATQAVSWSMCAAAVVMLVVLLQQLVAGVAACFRCWAVGAGSCMVVTQAMLGVSLLLFRAGGAKGAAAQLVRAASGALGARRQGWLGANGPVLLMYAPLHTFFALFVLSFSFLSRAVAAWGWVAFLLPYYSLTYRGNPAHTGCRTWPWLLAWFRANIQGCLENWFGSVQVLYDDGSGVSPAAAAAQAPAPPPGAAAAAGAGGGGCAEPPAAGRGAGGGQQPEPQQPVMFGFQPHGLYPTGAGFLPWLPGFRAVLERLGSVAPPITMVASVLFSPPFIREIACWAGFRQVSKPTFLAALRERGSVLFCPGGQAEMVHAWRAFLPHDGGRELVLHTRHRGFCRIAIEQQALLVPVLALGEILQLANLINLPALQAASYRRLGFPVPFILAGRWGSPLPRRVPLLYVVGAPLRPPPRPPGGGPVPAADVDALHAAYYASLAALFERHRHLHPEFARARLVLTDE